MSNGRSSRMVELDAIIKAGVAEKLKERKAKEEKELEEYNKRRNKERRYDG